MGHGDFDQTNLAPLHDLRKNAVINWRRTNMGSTLFVLVQNWATVVPEIRAQITTRRAQDLALKGNNEVMKTSNYDSSSPFQLGEDYAEEALVFKSKVSLLKGVIKLPFLMKTTCF